MVSTYCCTLKQPTDSPSSTSSGELIYTIDAVMKLILKLSPLIPSLSNKLSMIVLRRRLIVVADLGFYNLLILLHGVYCKIKHI
ncbi:unnamed protein product [Amaranthus hypochondriacus]